MCYSGRCLWEDWQGDCGYPRYILGGYGKCNCTMQEYIDDKNEVTKHKKYQERQHKIKKIKEKSVK